MTKISICSWGPTATGLAVLPLLPYMYDEIVEHIVDRVFEPIEKKVLNEKEAEEMAPVAHYNIIKESE